MTIKFNNTDLQIFFLCWAVTGLFLTGPALAGSSAVVRLTLSETRDLALQNNAQALLASERISESGARKARTISELVPHVFGEAAESRVWKENLAALGFPEGGIIGPFNTFDARVYVTEKIFDLSAAARIRAGITDEEISRYENEDTRQKIAVAASLAYIDRVRGYGKLKAAVSSFHLAKRLLLQTEDMHRAGMATGPDIARAETRVAEESLRLNEARLDFYQAGLQLCRLTGLPFNSRLRLTDRLAFFSENFPSEEKALEVAQTTRQELKVMAGHVRMKDFQLTAAKAELSPKVNLSADYGTSGERPDDVNQVSEAAVKVRMPFFDGGDTRAAIRENASQKRQEEILFADLKRNVEEDVYMALRRLGIGAAMIDAAQKAVFSAQRELTLSRHRFAAGTGDNVDVISAETSLSQAWQADVQALAEYHIARMNFYAALGNAEKFYLNPVERNTHG